MAGMTSIERVSAVLAGEKPDHPPVSFWHHFSSDRCHGQAAIDAHLNHVRRFGLDFLKVMNDNPYPAMREIRSAADLRGFPVLRGDEEGYARQLGLLGALSTELSGKLFMATTIFNAWAVLRRMATPAISDKHGPPKLGGVTTDADARMTELLLEDRTAVGMALDAIATSQANFARKCVEAGADGVFLSVRDEWVNTDAQGKNTYEAMVRPGDRKILEAACEGRFNMLHVCGVPQDLDIFAEYAVHAINWADRAGGPPIAQVVGRLKPTVCGGVDNLSTLPKGTPQEVADEVHDALRQAGDRPIMISAGCTYDPDVVPEANLDAMVKAAAQGG